MLCYKSHEESSTKEVICFTICLITRIVQWPIVVVAECDIDSWAFASIVFIIRALMWTWNPSQNLARDDSLRFITWPRESCSACHQGMQHDAQFNRTVSKSPSFCTNKSFHVHVVSRQRKLLSSLKSFRCFYRNLQLLVGNFRTWSRTLWLIPKVYALFHVFSLFLINKIGQKYIFILF